jgi:hypothetical protein
VLVTHSSIADTASLTIPQGNGKVNTNAKGKWLENGFVRDYRHTIVAAV